MKMLKFGTNVDLSDDNKWKSQLQELSKMPPFCRLISGCNMLSHLGHTVLGMNTTQLYMKVGENLRYIYKSLSNFCFLYFKASTLIC
uniref:Phosphoglycerate kinase n=1 Tax=Heterorhabditis bacteriophora TaxID=37862 RepID=A0A1I7WPH3_HETBA